MNLDSLPIRQLNREEAIAFARQEGYRSWTPEKIVAFQLGQDKLCMDIDLFHYMIEKVLGRQVFNSEFANPELLMMELLKLKQKPSLEEIFKNVPKEKQVIIMK